MSKGNNSGYKHWSYLLQRSLYTSTEVSCLESIRVACVTTKTLDVPGRGR